MVTFFIFTSLATAILSFLTGIFVCWQNRKSKLNKLWFAVSMGAALWSLSLSRIVSVKTEESAIIWNWFLYFGATFIPIFYFHFTSVLLGIEKQKKKSIIVGYILSIICLILVPTKLFVKSAPPMAGFDHWLEIGPLYYFYVVIFFIYVIYSSILILQYYRKVVGVRKSQLLYVLITGFIGFGGAFTDFFPQIFNIYPFGHFLVGFYVAFIAYAITRYRLMDIRAIIFRSIAFGLVIFIITGIFSIIAALVAYLFSGLTGFKSIAASGVIIATLVSLFYQPLRVLVGRITNTFLYKKTYDPDILIAKITEVTASILNLKQLLTSICGILTEAFHSEKIGVALLKIGTNKKQKLEVAFVEGFKPGIAESLVKFPDVVSIMYKEIKRVGGILIIDEMKTRFENGEFKPVSEKLLGALHENDIALIVPLYTKEKLTGVITIGTKKSGDPYNRQDLRVLNIISGQAAIAIDNAQMYGHLEELVKERTEELENANIQLRQLDKSKSEFLSIASHQLRTPLTAIKGWISMIEEGDLGAIPEKFKRPMDVVYASNERLIRLVNDLLNISRIESGRQKYEFKYNDLNSLVQEVITKLKLQIEAKKLKLIYEQPKVALPKVWCDGEKIHEVMMNFVDNAVKYSLKGSINVSLKIDDGMVTYSVKDNGVGITKNNMQLLFKKFSRGEGSFLINTEGTGLGLYVAKLVVEAHGGKIWAESEGEGKGSTFLFSIPVKDPKKNLVPDKK